MGPGDIIFAQLACPLNDIMFLLTSGLTNLSLNKHWPQVAIQWRPVTFNLKTWFFCVSQSKAEQQHYLLAWYIICSTFYSYSGYDLKGIECRQLILNSFLKGQSLKLESLNFSRINEIFKYVFMWFTNNVTPCPTFIILILSSIKPYTAFIRDSWPCPHSREDKV